MDGLKHLYLCTWSGRRGRWQAQCQRRHQEINTPTYWRVHANRRRPHALWETVATGL